MPLLIITAAIIILLFLVAYYKINAFIALLVVALGAGLALGMDVHAVIDSVKKGVGGTLGELAIILGFGTMLGELIGSSGAAQRITTGLTHFFGIKRIPLAMTIAGFIVGIPMFYSVAFVMLIPLIFAMVKATKLPLLYVGLPMISALSVTHGFLPPHPAPTTISNMFGVDIGRVLILGLILAVPAVLIAGWWFGRSFRNDTTVLPPAVFTVEPMPESELPSFLNSLLTSLSPVLLMGFGVLAPYIFEKDSLAYKCLVFLGDPVVAIMLAAIIALFTLGLMQGRKMPGLMAGMVKSIEKISIILLIIGAGGAFKQVLTDSGAGDYIQELVKGTSLSPLLLGWCIAAALRVALGSATVAALTAAGIVQPIITATGASPELMVLAIGAGSLTLSNVNDTGFWLFKEYFNLSIGQTLRSWTVMETIVSLVGLGGVLLMNIWL